MGSAEWCPVQVSDVTGSGWVGLVQWWEGQLVSAEWYPFPAGGIYFG